MFNQIQAQRNQAQTVQQERMLLLGKAQELESLLSGQKHNPTVASPAGPYGHGVNGLFNIPTSDYRIFSAMMYPDTGSLGDIPVVTNPPGQDNNSFGGVEQVFMTMLTGVTNGALDDPLNQPTAECTTGPIAGLTKLGTVVNTYGRYRASTAPVSIVRAGMRSSQIDPMALQLMNPPSGSNPFWPSLPAAGNILINELSRRLWELTVSFQRMFAAELWTGNPALNSGQRKFLWGLNSQINTNTHVDYQAAAILTAANPFVHNFQYGLVNGTANIVQALEEMDAHLMYKAQRQRLTPFTYKLRMRPEVFREITAVWPIKAYFESFTQVSNFTNGRVVVSANEALEVRDQMRRSQVLPINGHFVEVVLDDSIPEQTPVTNAALTQSGTYASNIYATPSFVIGNVPALYWDYYNHDNENSQSIAAIAGAMTTFTSDAGLFRWYVNFLNGCLQLTLDMLPRLNLITPQLSGLITNVAYRPLQHLPTMQPTSNYFVNGGVTSQTTPTQLYTGWSTTTPTTVGSSW